MRRTTTFCVVSSKFLTCGSIYVSRRLAPLKFECVSLMLHWIVQKALSGIEWTKFPDLVTHKHTLGRRPIFPQNNFSYYSPWIQNYWHNASRSCANPKERTNALQQGPVLFSLERGRQKETPSFGMTTLLLIIEVDRRMPTRTVVCEIFRTSWYY